MDLHDRPFGAVAREDDRGVVPYRWVHDGST